MGTLLVQAAATVWHLSRLHVAGVGCGMSISNESKKQGGKAITHVPSLLYSYGKVYGS